MLQFVPAHAGNFKTLRGAIQQYSADGLRLCLAVAGDSMADANFEDEASMLRLSAVGCPSVSHAHMQSLHLQKRVQACVTSC